MIKEEYKFSELTPKIIGCAMTVHRALGNGFQEVIYQRALGIEMADNGISFSREHECLFIIQKVWNLNDCSIVSSNTKIKVIRKSIKITVQTMDERTN